MEKYQRRRLIEIGLSTNLIPARGLKRINQFHIPAVVLAFHEPNPRKGTETNLPGDTKSHLWF